MENDTETIITDNNSDGISEIRYTKISKINKNNKILETIFKKCLIEPTYDNLQYEYFRFVEIIIKNNRIDLLNIQCNKSVIKRLHDIYKSDINDANVKYKNGDITEYGLRRIIKSNKIDKLLNLLFIFYKKHLMKKIVLDPQIRIKIFTLIIDCYDVIGKTKLLINNLIKYNIWPILDLINNITPILTNEIRLKNITENKITELNKIGIILNTNARILFSYNKSDDIIKYIEEEDLYKNKIDINDIRFIKDNNVLKYLCDNKMISLKKKSIKVYHQKCYLFLLTYLIENNLIKESTQNFNHIFKKKKEKKKEVIITKKRYRRYRHNYKNRKYNKNAICKDFKENISKYLNIIKLNNLHIKLNNQIKYCFFINKNYGEFINLINNTDDHNMIYIDKYEKMNLFKYCLKTDNVDMIKILIDKKILLISELHTNKSYITKAIIGLSKKILKYLIKDLKVKCIVKQSSLLYVRYGCSNDKIIDILKIFKEYDVPLDSNLLTYALRRKKSIQLINILINDFDFKLEKKHIKYIKCYPKSKFNKLMKNIKYNKKRLMNSILSSKYNNCHWRYSRNLPELSIGLKLLSDLTLKEKEKYVPIFLMNGIINNNLKLIRILKQQYNVYPDFNIIKKLIYDKKLNMPGIDLLISLISDKTEEEDIKKIKDNFNDDELLNAIFYRKCTDSSIGILCEKKSIKFIKKTNIQINIQILIQIIDNINIYHVDNIRMMIYVVSRLIKQHKLFIENNIDFIKKIINILSISFICPNVILNITNSENNCINYITSANIYLMILFKIYYAMTITDTIEFIAKHFLHLMTPYIYHILIIGENACKNNIDIWYKKSIAVENLELLCKYQPLIAREDYEFYKEKYGDLLSKNTKFNIIDSYVPLPNEISESIEYYIDISKNNRINDDIDDNNIINVAENRAIFDEIDQAIIDAQKIIINDDSIIQKSDNMNIDIDTMIGDVHMKCKRPEILKSSKKIKRIKQH